MTEDNQDDLYFNTEIESAIVQGDRQTFYQLIDNADLTHRSGSGSTLLHKAVTGPRIEMASELIERGVDIDATDDGGYTALHRALEKKEWELAELLIEHGADPNSVTVYGITPLHTVIGYGRLDNKYVTLLLEHGADPHLSGDSRRSPLEMAREVGYDDIAELLEEATEEQ